VFDVTKLDWLNARYIRETLDVPELLRRVRDWAFDERYLAAIAGLAQKRIERLSDLGPLAAFFFAGRLAIGADAYAGGKLDTDAMRKLFVLVLASFDALPDWELASIEGAVRRVVEISGAKLRDAVRPLYVAVTGSPQSVPLFDSMALLGRDLVRERLRVALETLDGATNAESTAWRKLLAVPTADDANGGVA
jgi:glutamyl-tRNA synthetase